MRLKAENMVRWEFVGVPIIRQLSHVRGTSTGWVRLASASEERALAIWRCTATDEMVRVVVADCEI